MNWIHVAEVKEVSKPEFRHHADGAGISSSDFPVFGDIEVGFIFNKKH